MNKKLKSELNALIFVVLLTKCEQVQGCEDFCKAPVIMQFVFTLFNEIRWISKRKPLIPLWLKVEVCDLWPLATDGADGGRQLTEGGPEAKPLGSTRVLQRSQPSVNMDNMENLFNPRYQTLLPLPLPKQTKPSEAALFHSQLWNLS